MLSCENCEIFNYNYFEEHLRTTSSEKIILYNIFRGVTERLRTLCFFICGNVWDSWNEGFQEKKFSPLFACNWKANRKGAQIKCYVHYSFLTWNTGVALKMHSPKKVLPSTYFRENKYSPVYISQVKITPGITFFLWNNYSFGKKSTPYVRSELSSYNFFQRAWKGFSVLQSCLSGDSSLNRYFSE